ncbi:MAG TPA: NAD(P)/FAD-dependent oxidoreductase [Dongiaceae bacterium]|nr:NAD(P)/FAD-dependent oxidoreductase [Dongiaceae bacterium]
MSRKFDVLVLGAGAAGLFCAAEAGRLGKRVAVLEREERAGKKILISGGGRCNFTNLHTSPGNFLSANPHFAKSALARFTPRDFVALVEKYRIPYHEKTLGQLFCDGSAQDILGMLEAECRAGGVQVLTSHGISEVRKAAEFEVQVGGAEFRAPALVVATGGLSIPKMGATGFGYQVARKFGLRVVSTRPALVPLVFAAQEQKAYCDLAGVSAEVIARCGEAEFREKMLITHRGLSGPAILQASSYWQEGEAIELDLAPGRDVTAAIRAAAARTHKALETAFAGILPKRLAERWLAKNPPEGLSNAALEKFERGIHAWRLRPAGTEGYAKAEVTAGGVDTEELSSKTMESKKVPGLFFVGEVVDVTGWLGGFNFQWAWASAAAAARSMR